MEQAPWAFRPTPSATNSELLTIYSIKVYNAAFPRGGCLPVGWSLPDRAAEEGVRTGKL